MSGRIHMCPDMSMLLDPGISEVRETYGRISVNVYTTVYFWGLGTGPLRYVVWRWTMSAVYRLHLSTYTRTIKSTESGGLHKN